MSELYLSKIVFVVVIISVLELVLKSTFLLQITKHSSPSQKKLKQIVGYAKCETTDYEPVWRVWWFGFRHFEQSPMTYTYNELTDRY